MRRFAGEVGGEALDENGGEGFSFWEGESGPGSVKVGVGVSVETVKQIGDGKVDKGLLVG